MNTIPIEGLKHECKTYERGFQTSANEHHPD